MIWSTLKSFANITELNRGMKRNDTLNQNMQT